MDSNPNSSNNEGILVDTGEGHSVSMQAVQNIYNEITGKTESIGKNIRHNYLVDINNITQLHNKIAQLHEQYNIVSSNCSVSLYKIDDKKEEFSSFERFRMYDASTVSPVESINLTYNFLIVLPQVKRQQSYKITITLQSRAGVIRRSEKERDLPPYIFRMLAKNTGSYEIEYVDYTVARTFMVAIDDWIDSLPVSNPNRLVTLFQERASDVPFYFRLLATIVVVFSFYYYFSTSEPSFDRFLEVGVVAFGAVYIAGQISYKIGQLFENRLFRYLAESWLKLTAGDEQIIEKIRKRNGRAIWAAVGSGLAYLALNVGVVGISGALGL